MATFYSVSGGGAAGFVVNRLNVRAAEERFDPDRYALSLNRGYDARLHWLRPDTLVVSYPREARVDSAAPRWGEPPWGSVTRPSRLSSGSWRAKILRNASGQWNRAGGSRRRANDTLKPSGARFREASRLCGWRAPRPIDIFSPGEPSRPRLNVGR